MLPRKATRPHAADGRLRTAEAAPHSKAICARRHGTDVPQETQNPRRLLFTRPQKEFFKETKDSTITNLRGPAPICGRVSKLMPHPRLKRGSSRSEAATLQEAVSPAGYPPSKRRITEEASTSRSGLLPPMPRLCRSLHRRGRAMTEELPASRSNPLLPIPTPTGHALARAGA